MTARRSRVVEPMVTVGVAEPLVAAVAGVIG